MSATAKTVGELRALLADLADDMPLHRRGDMGEHPQGVTLVLRYLAASKVDPNYFADLEHDTVWSKPEYHDQFETPIRALCTF